MHLNLRKKIPVLDFFLQKTFLHYVWISALYSIMNIFLLWLMIDKFKMPTISASVIVITGTFILRYILFRLTKIM